MCSQPSSIRAERRRVAGSVVALEDVRAADEHLAVVGDPDLGARERAPDGAELVVGDGRRRGHRRRLGHAVALEHGRAAGVEELEDLLRDRRRAGRRLLEPPAEDPAHVHEQLGVGLVEHRLQLGRDLLARLLHPPDLQAELGRARDLLRVVVGRDQRVDLLEDPRHRRQVGRLGRHQVRARSAAGRRSSRSAARRGRRASSWISSA